MSEEIDNLKRELAGTQEMLAFVLASVGEEVVVPKEYLKTGLPDGAQIRVDDTPEAFVFSLEVTE